MTDSIKKAYVDTPGGQVHYRERAGDGTPLVMLHQTASSSKMFDAMMAGYPAGRRLIALDTPGFGGSFEPGGEPTMADYGEMLFAAIKALGLTRVHLHGHHTGASVAIEIAAAHPDAVASLSMIGPVVLTEEERGAFGSVYPKPFEPQDDGSHLQLMWDYVAELGATDLTLKHREFVDTARAWAGHIRVYRKIWEQDFAALFGQISAPMQIMCSPDDVLWVVFERAKAQRPDAQVVELGGSNFQPDQDTAAVNAALAAFVDQHDG